MPLPASYLPVERSRQGRFVVVEGVSGSGKSSVVHLLAHALPAWSMHILPPPFPSLCSYINTRTRPLPQLAFYLTGVLHGSDLIRDQLPAGHVVADRYVTSVIANHAAVNGLDDDDVLAVVEPYLPYLVAPDLTVYLHTSGDELRRRLADKPDQTASDRLVLHRPALLRRLQGCYDRLAANDPTAVHMDTDGRAPEAIATDILDRLKVHHAD